jgi:hypothetical protein
LGAIKKRRKTMLKKTAAVVALVVSMAGAAYAAITPGTGVTGSLHDMNYVAGATPDAFNRACVFCHTPHNAANSDAFGTSPAPLWNRNLGTVVFTPYAWVAPSNAAGGFDIIDPLIGPTRLCMSCHDGSIAADSHNTNHAQAGSLMITGAKQISDLSFATHPIGFNYDAAATARGANELMPGTTAFITGEVTQTFDTKSRGAITGTKTIASTMFSGFMTCASCHEVHNTNNVVPTPATKYNYFLWAKEEGSAICLSCHVK